MPNIVKRSIKNIVDGVATTMAGLLVLGLTIAMLWTSRISFVWEGIAGLASGTILLLSPKDVIKLLKGYIKAWGSKSSFDVPTNDGKEQVNDI